MQKLHKSGFTLIELLIVTVVVVSLMGVIFRLSGIAGSTDNRQETISRMQRLENCLSGYYAAFGSYPPVPLQGASRNVYRKVDSNHRTIQTVDDDVETDLVWDSVNAACMAQPVAAMFPPPAGYEGLYEAFRNAMGAALEADIYSDRDRKHVEQLLSMDWQSLESPGFLNPYQDETDSRKLHLFRYGLMSFLLPRYRFMLGCAMGSEGSNGAEAFNNAIDNFRQWTEFNPIPPRMDSGISYASWKAFCDTMGGDDDWQIDLIPSQAACARWMPNLSGIVSGPSFKFFGISIGGTGNNGIPDVRNAGSFNLYGAGGSKSSGNSGYPLNTLTVKDGWGRDFYYYSPPPYQTYVLWSAGADGKTFPPWVDLKQFKDENSSDYATALEWMADDIKFMSTGK